MSAETRWWLIRHAPIIGDATAIQGQLDPPCALTDTAALASLARRLPRQATWLTSPLVRCAMTASALLARVDPGAPPPAADRRLIEQHFGNWQGLSHDAVAARDPDGAAAFWARPATAVPPGGESFAAVAARLAPLLTAPGAAPGGQDIVVLGHAGTIRAALVTALGLAPAQALAVVVAPLSLTRIDAVDDGAGGLAWRVVGINWPAR